jgi:iron(III) transport system substrate-binding protein
MRLRRLFPVLLSAAVLAAAPARAADMTAQEAQLYEAAKPERELTWYVAQFSSQSVERVARAFAARYPGLEVKGVRTTGQVAFARLTQDLRAGQPQCDVLSTTDVGHVVQLKKEGQLQRVSPENAPKVDPAYRNMDPDGFFHATAANPTILIYNTKLVKEADAPKNWPDLLDPRWSGKVALAHPGYSGSMGSWVVLMDKLYGWQFFEKLEKLDPHIGRSLNDPSTVLMAGERAVGISGLGIAVQNKQAGNPIGIVYPTDGAKLTLHPSAILTTARHPNAAKLFLDYMLSVEFSEVMLKDGQQPLRPEVPPPEGALPISQIKVAAVSEEEVTAGVPAIIEKWRETFDR